MDRDDYIYEETDGELIGGEVIHGCTKRSNYRENMPLSQQQYRKTQQSYMLAKNTRDI